MDVELPPRHAPRPAVALNSGISAGDSPSTDLARQLDAIHRRREALVKILCRRTGVPRSVADAVVKGVLDGVETTDPSRLSELIGPTVWRGVHDVAKEVVGWLRFEGGGSEAERATDVQSIASRSILFIADVVEARQQGLGASDAGYAFFDVLGSHDPAFLGLTLLRAVRRNPAIVAEFPPLDLYREYRYWTLLRPQPVSHLEAIARAGAWVNSGIKHLSAAFFLEPRQARAVIRLFAPEFPEDAE